MNSIHSAQTKLLILFLFSFGLLFAQENNPIIEKLEKDNENLGHRLDIIEKNVDDILWYQRVGDVAFIDKVYLAGPPRWKIKDTTAQGAKNPLKFWSYVFIPKGIDFNKEYPLIVFPHGGVHSNFSTYYTHIIKELLAQQYIVVAAEYRGSTGYGKGVYERIDYGGLEYEDVDVSRQYMIDNYSFVDGDHVGIIGWSHGGLITLMNIFEHPENYKVAFAGVPVSDLIARMGYQTQSYRDLYSADYHIGQTAYENVEEYRRRSPAWQTHKFKNTPLLIHTNTNDDDVNVLEVEHLIKSLKADGKKFEYKIFEDIPGGHSFDRIDRKQAREIRLKIYEHLAKQLNPPKQLKTLDDIMKASYLK
ncbi:MAG: prolyl oligopeptidase family serine peptidase [Melioribacteraceae bacterium]|nr:prolyl oligopeptidase family serine peptidase [Melioribacteraceae bacterium]